MKLHPWILNQFKKRQRIYIKPTKMGGYLNGLIFLLFLLAIGYSNNLLLIFTLFLFGFNLIWLIQTHFHLHTLKLSTVSINDGHAGSPIMVDVRWKNAPEEPHDWKIGIETDDGDSYPVRHFHNETLASKGEIFLPKRGLWKFGHVCVRTEMPFGLYHVWVYFKSDVSTFVYPPLLKNLPPMEMHMNFPDGEASGQLKGPHDVWNLAQYQGEEARKISWKHYAKSGELVIKEGEELTKSFVHFRLFKDISHKEYVLSKMATQMVYCGRTQTPFILETPEKTTGAGVNEKHLSDCLRELAVC